MSYENCDTCLAHTSFCDYCPTKGNTAQLPTQEELQAVLEELFNRSNMYNEQLLKQLAHVRSRVVQLISENAQMSVKLDSIIEAHEFSAKEPFIDEQNDM